MGTSAKTPRAAPRLTALAAKLHGLRLGSPELHAYVVEGALERWPKFLRLHNAALCGLPVPKAVLIVPSTMSSTSHREEGEAAAHLKQLLRRAGMSRGPWHLRGAVDGEDAIHASRAGMSTTIARVASAAELVDAMRRIVAAHLVAPPLPGAPEHLSGCDLPRIPDLPALDVLRAPLLIQQSVRIAHLCVCATPRQRIESSRGPWVEVYDGDASLAGDARPRWSGALRQWHGRSPAPARAVWRLWEHATLCFGAAASDLEVVVDHCDRAHLVQLRPYVGVDPFDRATPRTDRGDPTAIRRATAHVRRESAPAHANSTHASEPPAPLASLYPSEADSTPDMETWRLDETHQSQALSPAHLHLIEMLDRDTGDASIREMYGWLYERSSRPRVPTEGPGDATTLPGNEVGEEASRRSPQGEALRRSSSRVKAQPRRDGDQDQRFAPMLDAIAQAMHQLEQWRRRLAAMEDVQLGRAFRVALRACRLTFNKFDDLQRAQSRDRGLPPAAAAVETMEGQPGSARKGTGTASRAATGTSKTASNTETQSRGISPLVVLHRAALPYLLSEWDLSAPTLEEVVQPVSLPEDANPITATHPARQARRRNPSTTAPASLDAAQRWRAQIEAQLASAAWSPQLRAQAIGELDDLLFSLGLLFVRAWYLEIGTRLGLQPPIGGSEVFARRAQVFLCSSHVLVAALLQRVDGRDDSLLALAQAQALAQWLSAQARRPPAVLVDAPRGPRLHPIEVWTDPKHTDPKHTGPQYTGPQYTHPQHLHPQHTSAVTSAAMHGHREDDTARAAVAIGENREGILRYVEDLPSFVAEQRARPQALREMILALPTLTAPAAVLLAELGATAFVIEHGGALSHAALMCAELGLDALIGCGRLNPSLRGQSVRLDMLARRVSLRTLA